MTIFVKRPGDAEEREKIFSFLYEIWATELQWETPELDHDMRIMRDDLDTWAKHFLATDDTGRVVGCFRNNHFSRGAPSGDLDKHLHLSTLFSLFGRQKVAISSRLAIAPASRGKTVTSQLFNAGYQDALLSGIDIAVCYAAFHLLHLYYQLGYRPYAPTFSLSTGTRVPLLLCVRDRKYLEKVESPFLALLPRAADDDGRAADALRSCFTRFEDPGFDRHTKKLLWAQMAHAPSQSINSGKTGLFQGISEEDLKRVMVDLTRLTFDAGEAVVNRNEKVSCMGVLLSGRLGVGMIKCDKPKIVSMLTPGEPFGALGGAVVGKRALDIVALERSEVVLFRKGSLKKLHAMGGEVGDRIARNLLHILSERLHKGQQTIASLIEGKDQEVRVRCNSIPPPAPNDPTRCLVESYGFDTLKDKDSEFSRLLLQATVAENVEVSKLTQIGVKDGGTFVDVGSGPGIISMMLAKYFPNSNVIGVEPDTGLRQLATERARSQGRHRCTFVDGVAEKMRIPDKSVNFCYARLLFQHLPNPSAALREMHRITAKDGLISVLDVDDAFVVTHPEIPGWADLQQLVAKAQQRLGGNRYIGRALLGLMLDAGIANTRVEGLPFTKADLGGEVFYQLVFGFKRQILERAGLLTEKRRHVFKLAETLLSKPDTFAIVVAVLAHGRATS